MLHFVFHLYWLGECCHSPQHLTLPLDWVSLLHQSSTINFNWITWIVIRTAFQQALAFWSPWLTPLLVSSWPRTSLWHILLCHQWRRSHLWGLRVHICLLHDYGHHQQSAWVLPQVLWATKRCSNRIVLLLSMRTSIKHTRASNEHIWKHSAHMEGRWCVSQTKLFQAYCRNFTSQVVVVPMTPNPYHHRAQTWHQALLKKRNAMLESLEMQRITEEVEAEAGEHIPTEAIAQVHSKFYCVDDFSTDERCFIAMIADTALTVPVSSSAQGWVSFGVLSSYQIWWQ